MLNIFWRNAGTISELSDCLSINSSEDRYPRISPDGSILYFTSSRPNIWISKTLIWQAPIEPVVDFNGDGIVDSVDMCIMVDHWGTDNSICDISSMSWGDGIVDLQDPTILAEYIGEELDAPTLVAHWAFDEGEGTITRDSAGDNDGTVMGTPVWRPDGGHVDGALELDGTVFIVTDFVLNPTDGPFSVFAWVKGGGPGQVIVSQTTGKDWLMADPASGCLMTELKYSGQGGSSLCSETVLTDGDWHRVGFARDGSYRTLYVDDMPVAEDTQKGLADVRGGLYIGCGTNMTPGTFWTGLIDDVRIYNRAVKPQDATTPW